MRVAMSVTEWKVRMFAAFALVVVGLGAATRVVLAAVMG